jgi:hypothetical protein
MPDGPARQRKCLITNALLVFPTAKKLCLACEFCLDTHSEGRLASGLANAALYDTGKRSRVDCHNDSAHVSSVQRKVYYFANFQSLL